MVFSCVVPFRRKKKKIPDLSLPPCIGRKIGCMIQLKPAPSKEQERSRATEWEREKGGGGGGGREKGGGKGEGGGRGRGGGRRGGALFSLIIFIRSREYLRCRDRDVTLTTEYS
jgi:hypothetical protein